MRTLIAALLILPPWPAWAQQPFSTDDAGVTAKGMVHVEVFNEYDWLQRSQAPHLQQNTINMRVNYGLGSGLELDLDSPLILIVNDPATVPSLPFGLGDTDFGIKCNFREEQAGSSVPALTAAVYIEVPTGDVATGLGSGLTDVWVYGVMQKTLDERLTLRLNGGYLFAGNTSTGVVGIVRVRGHIATMGASLTRQMSPAWVLGAEITAAATHELTLNRQQLQVLVGGSHVLRENLSLDLGVVAGRFAASPRVGIQVGFSLDVPR